MKNAIDLNRNLSGVRAIVCEINENLDFKNKFKMSSITNYNSFAYDDKEICLFRHYNIGFCVKKIFFQKG